MSLKTALQNTVLISVSFLIGYYTVFGPRGVVHYCTMSKQVEQEKKKIQSLQNAISDLKTKITIHQTSAFQSEKIARYDYALGCTNELIYVFAKEPKKNGET